MSETTRTRPRRPGLFYRLMMGFFGLFDRWLHLSCRAFAELASAKLDRRLTRGERFRHSLHRSMCRLCRVHEHRLEQLHALALEAGRASANDEAAPEELSAETRERMREAIRAADRRLR
jgi:hypothetical protein